MKYLFILFIFLALPFANTSVKSYSLEQLSSYNHLLDNYTKENYKIDNVDFLFYKINKLVLFPPALENPKLKNTDSLFMVRYKVWSQVEYSTSMSAYQKLLKTYPIEKIQLRYQLDLAKTKFYTNLFERTEFSAKQMLEKESEESRKSLKELDEKLKKLKYQATEKYPIFKKIKQESRLAFLGYIPLRLSDTTPVRILLFGNYQNGHLTKIISFESFGKKDDPHNKINLKEAKALSQNPSLIKLLPNKLELAK